jgi:hypothetical protein
MQLSQLHRFRHVRRSKKTCASPSSFELHMFHTLSCFTRCRFFSRCMFPFCAPRAFVSRKIEMHPPRARPRVAPAELLRASSGSIRRCRPLAHTPQKRNQRGAARERECVRLQLLTVKIKPRLTYIITSFKVRHWIPTSVLSNCYPRESEARDVYWLH